MGPGEHKVRGTCSPGDERLPHTSGENGGGERGDSSPGGRGGEDFLTPSGRERGRNENNLGQAKNRMFFPPLIGMVIELPSPADLWQH